MQTSANQGGGECQGPAKVCNYTIKAQESWAFPLSVLWCEKITIIGVDVMVAYLMGTVGANHIQTGEGKEAKIRKKCKRNL